jgi:D-lactate dehydrogenase (cytochrome)
MADRASAKKLSGLVGMLQEIAGPDRVILDAAERDFYSADLFFSGATAAIIVQPGTRDELVATVRAVTREGIAVVPRGGGLSYTRGYVPQRAECVLVDTRRVDRIVEIHPDDMLVTVEAGCTWAALHAALAPHGLRVPHFGPASGRVSTIGGGLSQNSVFFGSGTAGTAADCVLSLEIVLANGEILRTGSAGIDGGSPFLRYHGPDLSGLFLGDCGTLGVKSAGTFRLQRTPNGVACASFAFRSFEAIIAVQTQIAREQIAAECLGLGSYVPTPARHRGASPAGGAAAPPGLHLVVEGRDETDAAARLDLLRPIAAREGTEVEPVVPRALRADPFGFVNSPLDEQGRLQAWTHGIVPLSRAPGLYAALVAFLDEWAEEMARHTIEVTVSTLVAGNALLLEPVLYWHDTPRPIHLWSMSEAPAQGGPEAHKANPAATETVVELRGGLRDLFARERVAHLQIGKYYNYLGGLDPAACAAVEGIKTVLDPHGLMNPGALGLATD